MLESKYLIYVGVTGLHKIEDVFCGDEYSLFVKYCTENGICFAEELVDFNFMQLYSVKWMGEAKISRVRDRFLKFCQDENTTCSIEEVSYCLSADSTEQHVSRIAVGGLDVFRRVARSAAFIRMCRSKDINSLEDISPEIFHEAAALRGIGVGTIEQLKQVYEENIIELNIQNKEASSEEYGFYPFEFICSDNEMVNVASLKIIGISDRIINHIEENGLLKIKDLKYSSAGALRSKLGTQIYSGLLSTLKCLIKPFNEIVISIFREYENDKEFKILSKRAEGYTLQKIGEEYDLSRARIGQIENKLVNKLVKVVGLAADLINATAEMGSLRVDDIDNFMKDNKVSTMLQYILKQTGKYLYFDFADMFLKCDEVSKNLEATLGKIAEEIIGATAYLYQSLEEVKSRLTKLRIGYIGTEEFINFLRLNGYRIYGDYVVKGKQSYAVLCREVVRIHFQNGIRVYDDEDLSRLRNIIKSEFKGVELPENNRALTARISEYLILRGRGIYTAPENMSVPQHIISTIKEHIEALPRAEIFYSELFDEFQGLLVMTSGIDNHHYLHGVLKFYYEGEYSFSRDYLTKPEGHFCSVAERINMILTDKGKCVHRDEIQRNLQGISPTVIFNSIMNESRIIQWGYNYFNSIDNIKVQTADIEELNQIINDALHENSGYTSDELLYIMAADRMEEFFKNNNIEEAVHLYYIVGYFFSDKYVFRRPHIMTPIFAETGLESKSIALSFLKQKDRIFYSKYIELTERLKWSPVTASMVFGLIEKDCIRVSSDEYVFRQHFSITMEQIEFFNYRVGVLIDKSEYLSIQGIFDYEGFPDIGYEWNEFLVVSLIEDYRCGYKIVEQQIKDRRYIRGVVIRQDFPITSFDELVVYIMSKDGVDKVTLYEFEGYLRLKGLIIKCIPKELYTSDYIKYDGETFSIVQNTQAY